MNKLDLSLLNEVRYGLEKVAYVPPPPFLNPELAQEQNQGSGQENPQQALEQVSQAVQQGLSEGVPPEQIQTDLANSGVPPEIIQQALGSVMSQGQNIGPSTPSSIQPPGASVGGESMDIKKMMEDSIREEKERRQIPPEELLLIHDKKIEVLTNIVQNLADAINGVG